MQVSFDGFDIAQTAGTCLANEPMNLAGGFHLLFGGFPISTDFLARLADLGWSKFCRLRFFVAVILIGGVRRGGKLENSLGGG
jgi:hypothetical protein